MGNKKVRIYYFVCICDSAPFNLNLFIKQNTNQQQLQLLNFQDLLLYQVLCGC